MTLIKKQKYLCQPTARGRHYSFANNQRNTPTALHANSCLILMNRRFSDFPEKCSNALSDVSSILGLKITKGLFVFATNLKVVRAVGLVRHNGIVSKATVGFRQLCVVIADRVKR